jgi:tetratricopeptide (TPR) repeat protein
VFLKTFMATAVVSALLAHPASGHADEQRSVRVAEAGSNYDDGYQQLLDQEATDALERGDLAYARHLYQLLLKIDARDPHAHREIGRTSHALGAFEVAVIHLRQADQLARGARDPELHYLLGEALYALGRETEAREAHAAALADIGTTPDGRMETLWLARIHARRGEVQRADELYRSLRPYSGEPDAELELSRAEAHIFAGNWSGAEDVLRAFLDRVESHRRATDMLGWVLEAQGKLEEETALRGSAADSTGDFRRLFDHGRALERSHDLRGALHAYQEARALDPDGTAELAPAIDRMRYRLTTELAAGVVLRRDPTGSASEWRAGAAVTLGSRHALALRASYESATGQAPIADADVASAGLALLVGRGYDVTAAIEVDVDYHAITRHQIESIERASGFDLGSGAEIRTSSDRALQVHARADLNMPWREAANTIREGGRVDGLTAHVYALPLGHRVVIDTGAQVRRLTLRALDGDEEPSASQTLLFGGADLIVWSDPTSTARGQILDEDLLWPTYLADAVVLSYRHYEAFSEGDLDGRIGLVDHARIDELSATARKALPGGALAFEARGGVGYDSARELRLWRGGGALLFTPWMFARLSLSYDVATESTTGLIGRRHAGWATVHVDL